MKSTLLHLLLATLPAPAAAPPLILSAPLTHSDWMLRPGAEWGPAGVRRMLDTCKAAGLTRIYWRALDGGRSLYKSSLLDPQGRWEDDSYWHPVRPEDLKLVERFGSPPEPERSQIRNRLDGLDYSQFDTLAEAVIRACPDG